MNEKNAMRVVSSAMAAIAGAAAGAAIAFGGIFLILAGSLRFGRDEPTNGFSLFLLILGAIAGGIMGYRLWTKPNQTS